MKFAEWAKMYMALAGLIASGVLGVTGIPLAWKVPLAIIVAVAGAFAVWKVENKPSDPPPPAWPAGTAFPAFEVYDVEESDEPVRERPHLQLVA